MRYRFIEEHREQFSVRRMCRALRVSPSGYYSWRSRPECSRAREDRVLSEALRTEFSASHQSYGSRRLSRALGCSRSKARRLMRVEGLVARKTRQFRPQRAASDGDPPQIENLLQQDFTVDAADEVWAADLTQIRTMEGWVHLAVILDLFSKRIVGWATSRSPDTDLCVEALELALRGRKPGTGLVHHSDRGCQYASTVYQEKLRSHGIRSSMSRPGNCYDNAVVESFFDTLKTEALEGLIKTRRQAHQLVRLYIDGFYNRRRMHSALGYLSPRQFEDRYQDQNQTAH